MSDIDPFNEFNAHLDELAEEAGVELDADDRRRICGASIAEGFTPESTVEVFSAFVDEAYGDDDEFEADDDPETGTDRLMRHAADDVERLEAQYGRPLTAREREVIARGVIQQADRFDRIDAEVTLDDHYESTRETRPDTNTSEGRQEFFKQRLAEQDPPAEIDPDRELDLDNQDDRHAFLAARVQGHEFEDAE